MPPTPKPIDPAALKEDAAHVAVFLRALQGIAPEHVDDDLIAFLDGVGANPLTLSLLAKVLTK